MNSGYLIHGGEVFDGSGDAPRRADVRIRDGAIAEIGHTLPPKPDEESIDARGLIVSPGLIDLHVHVFSGVGLFSVDPADAGLKHGVTTLLDTGTAGSLTYPAFHRFVMPQAREDIFALLNISMIGAIYRHDWPPHLSDLTDERAVHVQSAVDRARQYPDRIVGMKARLTAGIAGDSEANERRAFRGTLEAASQLGLPCMFHHAASCIPIDELLGAMRRGDIYTHCYHPLANRPFDATTRAPLDAALRARERGVIFDVGHGVGAFSWSVAQPACQQYDFWPDTISTDIHQFNLDGPVFDLPTTMSKFLHLGMPLAKVIRATTSMPAAAMGLRHRFGILKPGRQADVTLLRIVDGTFSLADVAGQIQTATRRIVAAGVLKKGRLYECEGIAQAKREATALALK